MKEIIEIFNDKNKLIGFVGHAAVAVVSLTTADGKPLENGKNFTVFSNSE